MLLNGVKRTSRWVPEFDSTPQQPGFVFEFLLFFCSDVAQPEIAAPAKAAAGPPRWARARQFRTSFRSVPVAVVTSRGRGAR
ncbi:hypothetical protein SKAU_G00430660 [Synaphobranchus kaupii]|uniref:Uncharacterized protein n=1 Tax=Synaphobranchus kaupii TaxID=118154 RepID=A0A9Q1I956_SYNKA|nr:hypothetical protein SKAU_G00430660 [Synaphobranchus kaupii]